MGEEGWKLENTGSRFIGYRLKGRGSPTPANLEAESVLWVPESPSVDPSCVCPT